MDSDSAPLAAARTAVNARAPNNSSDGSQWVLLVDPSPMSRACFAAAMSECPEIQVHGVDRIEAAELDLADRLPDTIVVQLSGEELSGQLLSSRVEPYQERYPTVPVLILANTVPADMDLAELAHNVCGYLTSEHGVDAVIAALRLIRAGLLVFPRMTFQQPPSHSVLITGARAVFTAGTEYRGGFTSRQQQVFELILDGLSNKKIADRLAIAESTVKVHVRAIMQRSGVSSRTQLVSQILGNRS